MGISNKRMRKKSDVNFINLPKNSVRIHEIRFIIRGAFVAFYINYRSFIKYTMRAINNKAIT